MTSRSPLIAHLEFSNVPAPEEVVKPTLAIIGAGGHGRVIADAASLSNDWHLIEFFDDNCSNKKFEGNWTLAGQMKILMDQQSTERKMVIVGIGNNGLRHDLQKQLEEKGWTIATVIHPRAIVSASSTIKPGASLMAGAIINTGTTIGAGCIINTKASIDHDCQIGASAHVSPGSTICGSVQIGDRTWIGAGSVVSNNVRIGNDTIVGAGSTVIRDLPDSVVAVGTPARIIRRRTLNSEFNSNDVKIELSN